MREPILPKRLFNNNQFEEWLRTKHAEEYIGTDDMMIDDFERWISELDIDSWLNYGEWYGNIKFKEGLKKGKGLENVKTI